MLLTISIRVNIPSSAESQCEEQGMIMKKQAQAKLGFWSWLLGCGVGAGGTAG